MERGRVDSQAFVAHFRAYAPNSASLASSALPCSSKKGLFLPCGLTSYPSDAIRWTTVLASFMPATRMSTSDASDTAGGGEWGQDQRREQ